RVLFRSLSVRTNHRPLVSQYGSNRSRNQTIPIEITAPVKISTARNYNRRTICGRIGLRDQIRARLSYVVRMAAPQRSIFRIGKRVVVAVCLVGRSYDNLFYEGTATTGFEQRPG